MEQDSGLEVVHDLQCLKHVLWVHVRLGGLLSGAVAGLRQGRFLCQQSVVARQNVAKAFDGGGTELMQAQSMGLGCANLSILCLCVNFFFSFPAPPS